MLADELEARQFSVWWDTTLLAGDVFREVVLRELTNARAVIVIWTTHSVKSVWVCSEADRARAAGKLVPVRADTLGIQEIPPPFDQFHTVIVFDINSIILKLRALQVTPSGRPLEVTPPGRLTKLISESNQIIKTWLNAEQEQKGLIRKPSIDNILRYFGAVVTDEPLVPLVNERAALDEVKMFAEQLSVLAGEMLSHKSKVDPDKAWPLFEMSHQLFQVETLLRLRQEAMQGESSAMTSLAVTYLDGSAIGDKTAVVRLLEKSTDLGNTDAMFRLGQLYDDGHLVDEDEEMAMALYHRAVALGDDEVVDFLKYYRDPWVDDDWRDYDHEEERLFFRRKSREDK